MSISSISVSRETAHTREMLPFVLSAAKISSVEVSPFSLFKMRFKLRSVITATFAGPRQTSLFPKAARPAAPCATYCYHAVLVLKGASGQKRHDSPQFRIQRRQLIQKTSDIFRRH